MRPINLGDGLRQVPVVVEHVGWAFRDYSTRLTVARRFRTWWLEIALRSTGEPLLVVVVERNSHESRYQRLSHRADATECFTYRGRHFDAEPCDPEDGAPEYEVPSLETVLVRGGDTLMTGWAWPVLRDRCGADVELVLLAQSDSESVRGRWRVRAGRTGGLPDGYSFLATGRWSMHQARSLPNLADGTG
jgi:hypothetical protein